MNDNRIFYPITTLTEVPRHVTYPATVPKDRFLPHIQPPCACKVLTTGRNVARVQFPGHFTTDIVSVEFLHRVGNHEIGNIVKLLKEAEDERSNEKRQDR